MNKENLLIDSIWPLKNINVIVALGKIAFDACKYYYQKQINLDKNVKFGHGEIFKLKNDMYLVGCYHPSPRNVNTNRINFKMMVSFLDSVKKEL